ncbi:hypothetical protein [Pseudocolwellia sp. HL-MZ7]|uniref:hypothetical protein n=1 Tax=Pseudocolwellia sp. HL-MZ7 TaxID=3400627 RepID=UPI003CE71811
MGLGYDFSKKIIFEHNIVQKKNPKTSGRVSIKYEAPFLLYDTELNKLADSLVGRTPNHAEQVNVGNSIDKGGLLSVTIERSTIGAANNKYFEFVVLTDEVEVYRRSGRDDIAEIPRHSTGNWWNIKSIGLKNPFRYNLKVYVIDKLSGGRDEFIITRPNDMPYSDADPRTK